MPRELRQRRNRPNYAILSGYRSDDIIEDDGDITSDDFVPPVEAEQEADDDVPDEMEDDDAEIAQVAAGLPTAAAAASKKLLKVKKTKANALDSVNAPSLGVSLSRPSKPRNPYALPIPPQDHRYRASPLYCTSTRVERLSSSPSPCAPAEITFTNNWTSDPVITDRYNKASIYNVGIGPTWEMIEDRSWWKESLIGRADEGTEACRRPKVYEGVTVNPDLVVLDRKYAFFCSWYHHLLLTSSVWLQHILQTRHVRRLNVSLAHPTNKHCVK